ncbi:MAG: DUF4258 domain-containing protein [Gammaproteobacteria bacterium]
MNQELLNLVREKAEEKLLFLPHAISQMLRPDRMISTEDIRKVIFDGEIIEDYPEDVRGHSCLILGYGEGNRALHVVCAPKDEYLAIITAYEPTPDQWINEFKTRRKK